MEIWKDIPGYEGIYQASTHGQIRTAHNKVTYTKKHGVRHWKSRILSGRGDNPKTGRRVSLWKDGVSSDCLVARLVAITFLGEPPFGYTVNHKDGNRLNNNVENLEWLTRGDNIRHGFATGLYHSQKKVELTNGSDTMVFRSMSEASRFLMKSKGYVSECLKKKKKAKSADGTAYSIRQITYKARKHNADKQQTERGAV